MAEGEVVRWLVKEGETLRQNQPMVEIMTDKATVEIASPHAGRVLEQRYQEGARCPVGETLIVIELAPGSPLVASPAPVPPASSAGPDHPDQPNPNVLATPATRRMARELGVDLSRLRGSGPGGQVTAADVRAAGATGPSGSGDAPAPATAGAQVAGDVRIPFRGVRRMIAEHMVLTQRQTAQFTYVEEVDCTELVELRDKAEARLANVGSKLTYLPFFVKAAVEALKKHPQLNATLDEPAGEICTAARVSHRYCSPDTRGADGARDPECGSALASRPRARGGPPGRCRPQRASCPERSGGSTFTITSLGILGGIVATPIVNFPEVAILAIHKIAKRPVVVDGKIVVRDMMNVSLTVDHRLVDGYDAATFVAEMKASLETPGLIFLDQT